MLSSTHQIPGGYITIDISHHVYIYILYLYIGIYVPYEIRMHLLSLWNPLRKDAVETLRCRRFVRCGSIPAVLVLCIDWSQELSQAEQEPKGAEREGISRGYIYIYVYYFIIVFWCIMLYFTMLYPITSYYFILHHIISYNIILYQIISYYFILHHIISYNIILNHSVLLYYVIFCYVLFYVFYIYI